MIQFTMECRSLVPRFDTGIKLTSIERAAQGKIVARLERRVADCLVLTTAKYNKPRNPPFRLGPSPAPMVIE
jgi:hypothetical protein